MERIFILMIDDDVEDQELMKEAFGKMESLTGAVHFVDTGQAALEFLSRYENKDELPRLIVLDLNMPKLGGLETLRMIKANEFLRYIPVIIFSSSFNPLDAEMSQEEGAIEYVTKPNSFVKLKEIAEKFAAYCVDHSGVDSGVADFV